MRRAASVCRDLGTSVKHSKNQLRGFMEKSQPGYPGSHHRDARIPVGSGWVVLKHKNKTKTKQKQKTLMFYICKFFKQDTYLLLLTKIIKITESKSGVLWYQKYQDWVLRCTLVTRLITFPVPVYALEELLKSCANFPPKDTGLLLGAFLVLQKVFSSQRT